MKRPCRSSGYRAFPTGTSVRWAWRTEDVDNETDEPQFATVKERFVGRHLTFVHLGGIQIGPDDLQVSVTKDEVRSAPDIEMHGEQLSKADESTLYQSALWGTEERRRDPLLEDVRFARRHSHGR